MTETIIKTTTCNHCGKEIKDNERYVNAGSYGAHLHLLCLSNMSATQLIQALALDDIKFITGDDWEKAEKVLYTLPRSINPV